LASVSAREFTAGERVEVDYAGDPIEWFDLKTREIHRAWVFVSVLGWSDPDLHSTAGGGPSRGFCPFPPTIAHFLIQVKPPTNATSDDGVASFSHRNRVSDLQLLRCSMPRDTRILRTSILRSRSSDWI